MNITNSALLSKRMREKLSNHIFLASDFQLDDVENPHIKYYSVNEALAKGVVVPELVINVKSIDRNKPNTLLWIDDEENFGEISINAFDNTTYESNFTHLKYCSNLEWKYSESRAKQLIQYIRKHLEIADKIEIWSVWNGIIENEPTQKTFPVQIENLIPAAFEEMSEYDFYCIVVTNNPLCPQL